MLLPASFFSCSASSYWTDVVPAPKNLQFSEVGQTSFRASWDHGAPDVALYRIGWSKKGENNFQFVSQSTSCCFQDKIFLVFSWSVYEGLTNDLLVAQWSQRIHLTSNILLFMLRLHTSRSTLVH